MKKRQTVVISILLACLLLLLASVVVVFWYVNKQSHAESMNYELFSAWTEVEEFQTIPTMTGKNVKIGDAIDYGSKHYVLDVNGTSVEEYQAYLKVLEKQGFQKHSDNGEDAMEGNVYTAAFQKDKLTVVVSHVVHGNKTFIATAYDMELSDHMIYNKESANSGLKDKKTKVHMLELNNQGACFIFELKNGHFMIQDSGSQYDAPYLLDYLEALTPGDEKPVVEGWFVSHPHADHYGALQEIARNANYKKRVYVNEVYFHRPPNDMMESTDPTTHLDPTYSDMVESLHHLLIAEDGNAAKGFRPQLGQRYYFSDMYVDIMMTPEQIVKEENINDDANDTSVWVMNHIEGQRFMIGADAANVSIRAAMNLLEENYFDVDIFAVLHHGINVYNFFTDYVEFDVALYPGFRLGSAYSSKSPIASRWGFDRIEENKHLIEKAKEEYSYANGTVILTFPYVAGTAEIAEPCDWRYSTNGPKGRYQDWGWERGDL